MAWWCGRCRFRAIDVAVEEHGGDKRQWQTCSLLTMRSKLDNDTLVFPHNAGPAGKTVLSIAIDKNSRDSDGSDRTIIAGMR